MFACPHCRHHLVRSQGLAGVYWACPACRGRAINLAVLKRVAGNDWASRLWNQTPTTVAARPCPTCHHPMETSPPSPPALPLSLDLCRRCYLVWFDPDEFLHVPQPLGAPPLLSRPQQPRLKPEEIRQLAAFTPTLTEEPEEETFAENTMAASRLLLAVFGFPLEEQQPRLFRAVPWVTWALAAMICLVSILALVEMKHLIDDLGLIPSQPFRLGGLTFFTSFFLHGGFLHLLGNVYFLVVFGDNVEDYLGKGRYLLLLMLATLGGALVHVLGQAGTQVPCIGASGGISGVIAFYALRFPHARLAFIRYFTWIRLPAWAAFGLWLVLQLLGTYYQLAGFSNVSALAHLGGAAVGVACWLAWRAE